MFNKTFCTVILLLAIICVIVYTAITNKKDVLKHEAEEAKIIIYTKSYCRFCKYTKNFLEDKKLAFKEIDITHNEKMNNNLKVSTGQNTVPYIFINDIFIGGFSNLIELPNKELEEMLQ